MSRYIIPIEFPACLAIVVQGAIGLLLRRQLLYPAEAREEYLFMTYWF